MNETSHYVAMGICILLVPIAQTLMKLGSKNGDSLAQSIWRPYTLVGLGILWVVTVLSVYSFQVVEVKTSAAWTSLTYVLVVLSSRFTLGEKITHIRWVGCTMIVAGILIFQLG